MTRNLLLLTIWLAAGMARAEHLGSWKIDDALTFYAQTTSAAGAVANADSAPAYQVYEDETAMSGQSGTMSQLNSQTGWYSEQITLSSANTYEKGKSYAIRITATVGGIASASFHTFQIGADVRIIDGTGTGELDTASGVVLADVTKISGDSTAADNAERYFDGAGYGPLVLRTIAEEVISQTQIVPASYSNTTDVYKGCQIIIRDNADPLTFVSGIITSSDNNAITFDPVGTPGLTIGVGDIVEILPPGFNADDRTTSTDIKTKTNFLPSATAGAAGGLFIAGSNAATTVNITGSITGNLSGSVGSIATSGITTGSFASGAINNAAFNVTETLTANPATGGIVAGSFGSGAIDNSAVNVTEVLNVNVTQWLGTAPNTPSVAGVPEVDITHLLGSPVCD